MNKMQTPEWWSDKINDLLFNTLSFDWDSETEAKLIKIIKEIQQDAKEHTMKEVSRLCKEATEKLTQKYIEEKLK